jgi:ribonucleoside-diphosphate reductase alpha chain
MRKVAWDRGPVRLGTYQKADGTHVPMWHDSEVAAIAFALQNIIARRNQTSDTAAVSTPVPPAAPAAPELPGMSTAPSNVMAGKKCPECGAHAMIRKDGCDYCTSCGHLGSCG